MGLAKKTLPQEPLAGLAPPRLTFQPLLHKATAGAPRGVAGPPSTGAAGGITPKQASTPGSAAGAPGRGVPRVLLWPSVPRAPLPTGRNPTGVHRRCTKQRGLLGTAAPAGTEDCAGQRGVGSSVRTVAASERPTDRNAVTAMHGGSPASWRPQELRNK